MAAWTKRTWTARAGTNLNKFTKSGETASSVILENTPDAITEPGTAFTTEAMNNIESGIDSAFKKDYSGEINALASKTPVGADVVCVEDSAATFAKKKTTLSAIISALVGTIGNSAGNVPVSNGTKCEGLYAEKAGHIGMISLIGTEGTPIEASALMNTLGNGEYLCNYMTWDPLYATDGHRNHYYYATVTGSNVDFGYCQIQLRLSNTNRTWVARYDANAWVDYVEKTDASGNAVNANSLGGVAAAFYPGFIGNGTTLQDGAMAGNTNYTAEQSGHITIDVSATNIYITIAGRTVAFVNNVGRFVQTFPIKAGQTFRVNTANFISASFFIKGALS